MTGPTPKKIVLMVSPGRQSTEAFHFCLHKAKEGGRKLSVIYALNGDGESPERSKKILEEAARQCRTFQVPFETGVQSGDYFELCSRLTTNGEVDLLVVAEKKRGFFKKLIEGSESGRLKGRVSCDLKIYRSD